MANKTMVKLPETIKIDSVSNLWLEIKKIDHPVSVDFKKVKNFDGAGFQFILFILLQNKHEFTTKNINEELKENVKNYGFKYIGEE